MMPAWWSIRTIAALSAVSRSVQRVVGALIDSSFKAVLLRITGQGTHPRSWVRARGDQDIAVAYVPLTGAVLTMSEKPDGSGPSAGRTVRSRVRLEKV